MRCFETTTCAAPRSDTHTLHIIRTPFAPWGCRGMGSRRDADASSTSWGCAHRITGMHTSHQEDAHTYLGDEHHNWGPPTLTPIPALTPPNPNPNPNLTNTLTPTLTLTTNLTVTMPPTRTYPNPTPTGRPTWSRPFSQRPRPPRWTNKLAP